MVFPIFLRLEISSYSSWERSLAPKMLLALLSAFVFFLCGAAAVVA